MGVKNYVHLAKLVSRESYAVLNIILAFHNVQHDKRLMSIIYANTT